MGARRGHAALTLCKQKRISLGTGAVFPSQSEMPKYLLYLDPGVFQETQRSLCEVPYSPLDIAPGLLTRAGSKAHGCQPHVSFVPPQASHRLWGSLRCPWPRASSVGSDQPFPHRERLRKGSRGPGLKGKEQQCLLQLPSTLAARAALLDGRGHWRWQSHPVKKLLQPLMLLPRENKKKVAFLTKLKARHPSLGCPGWGPHPRHPPAAAGQPPLPPFPSWMASQQGAAGEILASGGERQPGEGMEGKGGEGKRCISNVERTILASIPVIAATCWLPQPSPPSPRSPSPLLGLPYSPPRPRHAFHLLL